jgi:hypothetical protein
MAIRRPPGVLIPAPRTWRELAEMVREAHPACLVITMGNLREIAGGARVHYALPDIERELARLRIGHLGEWPTTQEQAVALYDELSPTGEFIRAVLDVYRGQPIDYGVEASLASYRPVDTDRYRKHLEEVKEALTNAQSFIAQSMDHERW